MRKWKRQRSEIGTYYGAPETSLQIANYGGGDWGVGRPDGRVQFWATSLDEAKLAAEVIEAGGDPNEHRTRVRSERRTGAIQGSSLSLSTWHCSCGEKQTGSSRSKADAEGRAELHRARAMHEFLASKEVA